MTNQRVCVIGAGPCGLACAKNLLQVGIRNFVVYEKNYDVGGNWLYSPEPGSHSSAYESLCAITSKRMSGYLDFPMPDDYPDYPSHALLLEYFRAYARRFGLYPFIRFHTEVQRVTPEGEQWRVILSDGTTEVFDTVLVANGHHWDPYVPTFAGRFEGHWLHSHFYKTPDPYRGQRVLVIGGGNSGCDIAVDVSRVARFTAISMRRGYHIIPKFAFFGLPADVVYHRMQWIPRWLRLRLVRLALWLWVGSPRRYGLPKPDHEVFATHPVVNSELLYALRHGKVHPRPDVRRFEGHRVFFVDGRVEEYDAVILATGYRVCFPFFDENILERKDGYIRLYLNIFHPRYPNLFFIGLIQPNGCIWNLADLQAKLVANTLVGRYRPPSDLDARIDRAIEAHRRRYIQTPRHFLEVDWHAYRRLLLKAIPRGAPRFQSVRE